MIILTYSSAFTNQHWRLLMFNCKSGDIAVITWDEPPVFSNVGKLVRVSGPADYELDHGLNWLITPIDFACGHLFIDDRDDGVVKRSVPGTQDVRHPDEWMMPIENPDHAHEEQEFAPKMKAASRQKIVETALSIAGIPVLPATDLQVMN
jgi:hypothetical protein